VKVQRLRTNFVISFIVALAITCSSWGQKRQQGTGTAPKTNREAALQTEKSKKQKNDIGDSIQIVSHIDLQGASVASMRPAEQWSQPVLELADTADRTLLTVDVADPVHPRVVKLVQVPAGLEGASLEFRVGDTALLTSSDKSLPRAEPKSVSIVSFADSERPKTVRRFDNVTSIYTDRQRGLIYLAGSDGLWILQAHSAADQTALEKQFEKMISVQ